MQRRINQFFFQTQTLSRTVAFLAVFAFGAIAHAEDVVLSWSDNSDNEDGFNIERAIGDGEFEALAQVGADVESYTDTTAERGVDYKYRVNAFNAFGYSGYTNVAAHYINVPPVLTALDDVTVEENETSGSLSFTVSDFETDGAALSVKLSSSNPDLLDPADVVLGGSGANRTFTLTPKLNTSGQSTITVTVSDGEDSSSVDFLFAVNAFVFPTLELALDSIASTPRAGEAFVVQTSASDTSSITSVSYWIGEELVETVSQAPYEATFAISEAGSYTLSAVAAIDGREQTVLVDQQVLVGAAPVDASIVENLATLSVEESNEGGSASYDLASDTFTLEDENGAIGGSSDSHRYYYLRASGDVSVEAQLSSLESADGSTVAGLMVRSALYGKSPQASLLFDGNSSLSVRTRSSRGGATAARSVGASPSATPWLKIERSGTTIRYYTKANAGDAWTQAGSDTLDLGDDVFLGFALAGGNADGIVAADFAKADFDGAIVAMGEDAVKPGIPSGLLISSLLD
ncbi:Ig-like domain-containing protein [Pelagicoccus sp. SDUM812005]|uniref:Ig-like domain-containing protein n=1 Tax=Pelagicoccus sp. SDUM812005 TaxID=3041257 RepID=UPI00280DA20C|nr:Ig-like domain-containing protein [Pelagicoccus sp. SDUM812005]MDQ8182505.1 Ig-like domain-containing protein [Pelagicoccus sp. SDUM812005]